MPNILDCEDCKRRRAEMIARAKEFAARVQRGVQNQFDHLSSLTNAPDQKQEENNVDKPHGRV